MFRRADDFRIAAHRADHPIIVFGAAVAVRAHGLIIPVLEFAHQSGQIGIELIRIIRRHNKLTRSHRIAAFKTCRGFIHQQHLSAALTGRDGRVCAGSAIAQNHNVIFAVPLNAICRFRNSASSQRRSRRKHQRAGSGALEKRSSGNFLFHDKNLFSKSSFCFHVSVNICAKNAKPMRKPVKIILHQMFFSVNIYHEIDLFSFVIVIFSRIRPVGDVRKGAAQFLFFFAFLCYNEGNNLTTGEVFS